MTSDQHSSDSGPIPLEQMPHAPDLFHAYRYWDSQPDVERVPGGWLYQGTVYPDHLTVGGACHFIFDVARKYCSGNGVDIGAGLWPLPKATPIDLERGEGKGHSIEDFEDASLDFVFSSHCLEHIGDWQKALDLWLSKLRPAGRIFLYLPHKDCALWTPGSPFVGDGHKWVPTLSILREEFANRGYEVVDDNEGPDPMMSFFICAVKPTSTNLPSD